MIRSFIMNIRHYITLVERHGEPQTFDQNTFFRDLSGIIVQIQQTTGKQRTEAVNQLYALIAQARTVSRTMTEANRRDFIAKVNQISGMKIHNDLEQGDQAAPLTNLPADPAFSRVPMTMRKPDDPAMRLMRLATIKQNGQTLIVAMGEEHNDYFIMQGTMGGEYRPITAPNAEEAQRRFGEIVAQGYNEVSPAHFAHLRNMM
jgi:hypothetical protein